MSKQTALLAPILRWTCAAVLGNNVSGVTVATIIKSKSFAPILHVFNALLTAIEAISEVVSSLDAILLSIIPVLDCIHSSEVSTIFVISKFVNTFFGTYEPVLNILTPI